MLVSVSPPSWGLEAPASEPSGRALLITTCSSHQSIRDSGFSLWQEDDLSLVPDSPLELKEQSMMPPPSYEDVTQGDLQDEQERR